MKVFYEEKFLCGSDITEIFKDVYIRTDLNNCDYVIITSIDNKISYLKSELHNFIKNIKEKNKKILFFGQGDVEEGYIPETLGFNFKNNLYKSKKYKNEFSLTSLALDRTPNFEFIPHTGPVSIGFCGATNRYDREFYLNQIKAGKYKTNFIVKNGPKWGTEKHQDCLDDKILLNIQNQAQSTFYENILSNLFTLSVRGWGNYSYRFSQTICLGRIPILIDTDCVLPFEEIFDYSKYIVCAKPGEDINKKINEFLEKNSNNLINLQKELYDFGNTFLTPAGYFNNIYKLIDYYERSC